MEKVLSNIQNLSFSQVLMVLFSLIIIVQWAFWIFGLGRFSPSRRVNTNTSIGYIFAELIAKLIDDFRHLLALCIMLVFIFSLIYSLSFVGGSVDQLSEALQAVTGALSGIIGVVIGYYFGESRQGARSGQSDKSDPAPGQELVQGSAASEPADTMISPVGGPGQ